MAIDKSRPTCGICGHFVEAVWPLPAPSGGIRAANRYECRTCGVYDASYMLVAVFKSFSTDDRYRLAGLTRAANSRDEVLDLTADSAQALLAVNPELTPLEQADVALEYLAARYKPGGKAVPLDAAHDYPLVRALGPEGLKYVLRGLIEEKLIERADTSATPQFTVTMKGFRRVGEIVRAREAESAPIMAAPPGVHVPKPQSADVQVTSTMPASRREMSRLKPGARFGPYEILGELGEGGMGIVYRARDSRIDEIVALKTLSDKAHSDPKRLGRFRAEIKLARKVTHQHVCRIHEFGEEQGMPFFTMEMIEGHTLKEDLKQGRLPLEAALDIAHAIAEGLQALHDCSVIHRDLKSSNVMRDGRGLVRLMDFGIAKDISDDATHTVSDAVLGSFEYMSPEHLRGQAEVRSDIYSLGIILYEMLIGHTPFRGRPEQIIAQHLATPPDLSSAEAAMIPPNVKEIVAKCLAKKAAERFRSARELANALSAVRSDIGGPASGSKTDTVTAVPRDSASPDPATVVLLRKRLRNEVLLALYHAKAYHHRSVMVHEYAEEEALKLGMKREEGAEAFDHLLRQRWAEYTSLGGRGGLTADGVERAERLLLKQDKSET